MLRMKKAKKIIVGNWKMNPVSPEEAKALVAGIKKEAKKALKISEAVLCPPAVYLAETAKALSATKLLVGSQDVHFVEGVSSQTGFISAIQYKNAGAKYAIIGHSERRERGDTDEIVNKKTLAALNAGLVSITCFGEKTRQSNGEYLAVIRSQIEKALVGVSSDMLKKVLLSYEPVWAIGAKEAMTPRDLHEMSLYIRKVLIGLYGAPVAAGVRILYGGSVNPTNAEAIMKEGEVDGLLVGRDSLNAVNFVQILAIAAKC